ncbi:hypothetical protein [Streptomyces sp. ML-6]|uniref:hypothetical protein n=1 Tax=Streptomyces sp. ML-6 TaxID=2982693 RepID=UPI0024C0C10B|nr:hypothetical protein [Streptomyces sp. ML-6]MDK0524591.1 hypothetical protein [Streptomyces sp. ML-6]
MLVAAWPAVLFGSLCLVGTAAQLSTGTPGKALDVFRSGVVAIGGSMAVGVLLGAATGGALALAPGWFTARAPLRGLLAAAVASTLFLAEVPVVFAAGTGPLPALLIILGAPVVGLVAAARSGALMGCPRHHP